MEVLGLLHLFLRHLCTLVTILAFSWILLGGFCYWDNLFGVFMGVGFGTFIGHFQKKGWIEFISDHLTYLALPLEWLTYILALPPPVHIWWLDWVWVELEWDWSSL